MKKSSVHILYGKNASGKTRYLREKEKFLAEQGKIVISNLHGLQAIQLERDGKKFQYFDDLAYELEPSGMSPTAFILREMLVSRGDVLLLDGIDAYLTRMELTSFLAVVRQMETVWEEIWIAGHSAYLTRACTDNVIYVLDNGGLVILEGEKPIYEYLNSL